MDGRLSSFTCQERSWTVHWRPMFRSRPTSWTYCETVVIYCFAAKFGIGAIGMSDKQEAGDDLETLLHRAVVKARFEVELPLRGMMQRTVCQDGAALREFFRQFEAWRSSVRVTILLGDDLLGELSNELKSVLRSHIVNGRVADGLPSYLLGVWRIPFAVDDLARICVRAAVFVGPGRVAGLLRDWERGAPVLYQSHVVLFGISVDKPLSLDLGKNKTAVLQELPKSTDDVRHHLPKIDHLLRIGDYSGAVKITVNHGARSALFRSSEPNPKVWDEVSSPYRSVISLCRSLSLACDNYVTWALAWSDSRDWRAFGQEERLVMYSRSHYTDGNVVPLTPDICALLGDMLSKKLHAEDGAPRYLDLALGRWIRSKRPVGIADQLVDLRIALEALYLDDDVQGELSFRLATHVAWHLGENADERLKYQTIARRAYKLASGVIHGRAVKFTDKENDLLADGQDMCRQGLLKMLDTGEKPDWKKLILGAEV